MDVGDAVAGLPRGRRGEHGGRQERLGEGVPQASRGDGPYRVMLGGTSDRYVHADLLLLFGLRLRRHPAGAGIVPNRLVRPAVRTDRVHGDQRRRVPAAAHRTVSVALVDGAGSAATGQRQVQ